MPTQSADLESADSVAITFEMQKNEEKRDILFTESVLCPLFYWEHLVNRIWTYPGASLDTLVCTVW